jgi:PAS domain S-box-containing protein
VSARPSSKPPRPPAHGSLEAKLRFVERLRPKDDGVLAFDRQCRYTYWGAQMERISGFAASEVLGLSAFEVFPFLRETGEERCFKDALDGRASVAKDRPFFIPETGREGRYEASYFPLEDDDGAVIGGVAVVRDTTEAGRVQQQLEETEARFRNMADVAPVLLWMSGKDSLCTFFNQTWLGFTGRSLEDELGVGWAEGVHFEDLARCMDTYTAAFNARRVFEMEYRLRRADGEYRWILDRGTPRYTPEGAFAGFIGSCVDITEHKTMETKLRRAIKDRDDFLAIASHELRTPLTALSLQLESALRTVQTNPERGLATGRLLRNAQAAVAQSQRLGALIEELLDVSRLAAGRIHLARAEVDLAALVHDLASRFEEPARAADAPINVEAPEPVRGTWDASRVSAIATNLLGNAVKYGAGSPIDVRVARAGDAAILIVQDRGIGIAEADQARIFERFERAVSTRHYGGFGLGLWIAREMARAHGGSIGVASTPGKGATFTVSLPLDGSGKEG